MSRFAQSSHKRNLQKKICIHINSSYCALGPAFGEMGIAGPHCTIIQARLFLKIMRDNATRRNVIL